MLVTALLALLHLSADAGGSPASVLELWTAYGLPPIPDGMVLGEITPGRDWLNRRHHALALLERHEGKWRHWSACMSSDQNQLFLDTEVKILDPKALTAEFSRDYQVFGERWGIWFADFYPEVEIAAFLAARGNPKAAAAAAEMPRNSLPWVRNHFLRPRDSHAAVAGNAFAYWLRRYAEAAERPAVEEAARRLQQTLPSLPTSALPAARRTLEGVLSRVTAKPSDDDVGRHIDAILDAPILLGFWQGRPNTEQLRRHPSYQAVAKMGLHAVPALLRHTADPRLGRVQLWRRRAEAELVPAGEIAAFLIEESLLGLPVPRNSRDSIVRVRLDFAADLVSRRALFEGDETKRQAALREYVTAEKTAFESLAAAIKKKDGPAAAAGIAARPWLSVHPDQQFVDALHYSNPEAARLLLGYGTDPNARWCPQVSFSTPFARAVDIATYTKGGWFESRERRLVLALVRDMAALGGDPTVPSPKHGGSALRNAIARKDDEVAMALAGRTPVDADLGGYGPLHAAAFHGNVAIAAQLLAMGADPEARTALGESPLDMACRGWYYAQVNPKDMVKLLIRAGAKQGLHHAAAIGDVEALTRQLDAGADPNAADSAFGLPPIAWAAALRRNEAVDVLAARRASTRLRAKLISSFASSEMPQLLPGDAEVDLTTKAGRETFASLVF